MLSEKTKDYKTIKKNLFNKIPLFVTICVKICKNVYVPHSCTLNVL